MMDMTLTLNCRCIRQPSGFNGMHGFFRGSEYEYDMSITETHPTGIFTIKAGGELEFSVGKLTFNRFFIPILMPMGPEQEIEKEVEVEVKQIRKNGEVIYAD